MAADDAEKSEPLTAANLGFIWWTHLDSNQGPLACEASALTGLSYASTGVCDYRARARASQPRAIDPAVPSDSAVFADTRAH